MERDEQLDDKTVIIRNALAEYFECDPDTVGAFVVCCERHTDDDRTQFSSAWSALPHWHITGFVDELRSQLKEHRTQAQLESMMGENSG